MSAPAGSPDRCSAPAAGGAERVIHVISNLEMGGAQRLLTTWVGEAARRGDLVTVVVLLPNQTRLGSQLRELGAEVVLLPGGGGGVWSSLTQVLRLVRLLQKRRPAVVQTHLTRAHLVGLAAATLARVPAVSTLHSMLVGHDGNSSRALRLETWVQQHLADAVVACGAIVEQNHRARLRPARAAVVANVAQPVEPLPPAARASVRLPVLGDTSPDARIVLAVGRLAEGKGYEDLLPAFAAAAEAHPDIVLVVVGDGPEGPALEQLAEELGIRARVRMLGQRHDVALLMAAADVYVSASHWEGLPLAMLEAMSVGLPVVVTSVGDVPKVVDEGSGVLVPPAEHERLGRALADLLSEPDRMQALGAAGRRRGLEAAGVPQWYDQMRLVHAVAVRRHRRFTSGRTAAEERPEGERTERSSRR